MTRLPLTPPEAREEELLIAVPNMASIGITGWGGYWPYSQWVIAKKARMLHLIIWCYPSEESSVLRVTLVLN